MSGSELKTVADVMTRKLLTVTEDDTLGNLNRAMHRFRVRHLPVVDEQGRLLGLVSHADLLAAASSVFSDRQEDRNAMIAQAQAATIMQREVLTIDEGAPLIEAGKLMWDSKIGCLPVVEEDGKLVGILTEADFIAIAVELLGSAVKKSDIEELARSDGRVAV
jgi:CBS domain-containing membrane protein